MKMNYKEYKRAVENDFSNVLRQVNELATSKTPQFDAGRLYQSLLTRLVEFQKMTLTGEKGPDGSADNVKGDLRRGPKGSPGKRLD